MTIKAAFPLAMSEIAAEYGSGLPFSLRSVIGRPGLPGGGDVSFVNCLGKSATAPGPGSFSVTVSSSAYGSRIGAGGVTTNAVTCTPGGGTFPYSYSWTYVSGDAFSPTAPTGASTAFTGTVNLGQSKSATYLCTVTDNLGATGSASCFVSVQETS